MYADTSDVLISSSIGYKKKKNETKKTKRLFCAINDQLRKCDQAPTIIMIISTEKLGKLTVNSETSGVEDVKQL